MEGSFENGVVSTTSPLSLTAEHCVHVYEGVAKLADCRLHANAVYAGENYDSLGVIITSLIEIVGLQPTVIASRRPSTLKVRQ